MLHETYTRRPSTPHNLVTVSDVSRLAALAQVDSRTALRWLAGVQVFREHAKRLDAALREIGA
jgi:hypothetical protein